MITDGAGAQATDPAPAPMPSHGKTLSRATIASLIATAVEFALLPLLVNVLHVSEAISYSAVQFVAQAITFTLNKYWAFEARSVGSLHGQGAKSLVVFVGSLVFNTALPSLGSYVLHRNAVLSFGVSQVIVYLAWNYPMNRYWVFARAPHSNPNG